MKFVCACLLILSLVGEGLFADTITNAVDLLPYLGDAGTPGIPFELSVEVTRGTERPYHKTFFAKSTDCHLKLVDKALWPTTLLKAGDLLHVRGTTAFKSDFVSADCTTIDIVGHIPPIQPCRTTIKEILQGKHPNRLVLVHGVVTDAFDDDIDHLYLRLIVASTNENDSASISMSLPSYSNALAIARSFIGAEIEATGTFDTQTRGLRKIGRSEVNLLHFSDIHVIKPPPKDPFSVPTIEAIIQAPAANLKSIGRRRASGTVIAVWQGNNVLVKDESGSIVKATLADGSPPAYGDSVTLAGIPETDLFHVNLRRAIWKTAGDRPRIADEAIPITADDLLTDGSGHTEIKASYHGKAVSLSGLVISLPTDDGDGRIRLKCGRHTLTVDTSSTPTARAGIEIGSTVGVRGTCVVKAGRWNPNEPLPLVEEVFIVVRTPADMTLLSSPPWWTPNRLLIIITALFAAMLSILLWNMMLRRVAERKSRELVAEKLDNITSKLKVEERTRIAVELHDSIAQNLTGVSLEIDSAEQLANKNPAGMMQHLRIAARTLQSCRNELRNCLWDLRSRALEENDLNEAIRRAIAPQISDVNLTIRFNVPRTKLTDDLAHVLMRIVRELAINAVRHGNAKNVWIAGSLDDDRLLFSVRDDGSGFDPDTRPGVLQGHFGLQGIHERVNQFNGTMEIASAPGHGTKVTISLNIPAKEQT